LYYTANSTSFNDMAARKANDNLGAVNDVIIVLLVEFADDSVLRWIIGKREQKLKIQTYL